MLVPNYKFFTNTPYSVALLTGALQSTYVHTAYSMVCADPLTGHGWYGTGRLPLITMSRVAFNRT